jgi:hypothetical protein
LFRSLDVPMSNNSVYSEQNNLRSMTSEEERLERLRRTLHSLANRIPKIILTRVDWTFPVLKNKAVSVTHPIMNLYKKHMFLHVRIVCFEITVPGNPIQLIWS